MKHIFKTTIPVLLFAITVMAQNADSSAIIKIGNQIWMIGNLDISKFRNGDMIPQAQSFEEWKKAGEAGKPVWCYYENNTRYGSQLGKLYNWYAVNDPRGLAPKGWHVARDEDWATLIDYLDGQESAGTKLKNNSGWADNGNGTNEVGFIGLPGGSRNFMDDYNNGFANIGYVSMYWSATESASYNAWTETLRSGSDNISRMGRDKGDGLSVRCVKD
jgi:uncharacterized protein (TIGR02145 family)